MGRHARAIGLLPGVTAVAIPAAIVAAWGTNVGWGLGGVAGALPVAAGAVLVGAGLMLMYRTISLFSAEGEGTLAPWDPPRKLVVRGPYRFVRNPMITGVLCILAGEAILFGSVAVAVWAIAFFAVNSLWFPLVEEPGLRRRFGREYEQYARNVPRWLPRRTPWTPELSRSRRAATPTRPR